jgi:hypothetical protein
MKNNFTFFFSLLINDLNRFFTAFSVLYYNFLAIIDHFNPIYNVISSNRLSSSSVHNPLLYIYKIYNWKKYFNVTFSYLDLDNYSIFLYIIFLFWNIVLMIYYTYLKLFDSNEKTFLYHYFGRNNLYFNL